MYVTVYDLLVYCFYADYFHASIYLWVGHLDDEPAVTCFGTS